MFSTGVKGAVGWPRAPRIRKAKEGKVRPRERLEEVVKFPGSLNIPFPSTNIELLSCDDLADMLNRDAFESLLAVVSLKI